MHAAGVLLLNFEARDYHNVVYRLVEEFGVNDDLSSETKAEVLRTLLLTHKYVDGHTSNFTLGNFKRSLSKSSLRGSMRGFSGVNILKCGFCLLSHTHASYFKRWI